MSESRGVAAVPLEQDEGGLLEREEEVRILEAAIDGALAGNGGLRLVEGPAGIGKSALLAAAGRIAAGRGMEVLSARATEIERELPFGAIRQLLEGHVGALAPERRRELLAGSAAPAAAVVEPAVGESASVPGIAAIYGLYWLIANLAEEAPLLLLLDDAQWADADSVRFLAFVAPRLAELPVICLVAARSDEEAISTQLAGTASDPAASPIVPGALSPDAGAALAAACFGKAVAPELAAACHRASGGNPFYLRALLDELRREGVEPVAGAAPKALSLGPQAVRRVIVARIAALPPAAAALSRAAAVLGDESKPHLAARLADLAPEDAADAVGRLMAAAILDEVELLSFAHPIVRNAVHADVGRGERTRLHRRAAGLLASEGAAAERLAAHLTAADPGGDPATVETLRGAAKEAIARGAPAAAVTYLRRALAEPPADDLRGDVLLELGGAELTVDGTAARDHLQEVLEMTSTPQARIAVARSLAVAHLSIGDVGRLGELLHGEIARAAEDQPDAAAALECDLVMALLTGLDGASVREAHERVERLAPALSGSSASERSLLACLAYSRLCRDLPVGEVVAPARRRLACAPADGPEALPSADWVMALGVLVRCGELDAAERAALHGLEVARASGSLYALGGAQWVLGTVSEARGRLSGASSQLGIALRGAREFGAVAGVHASLSSLVTVEAQRGEGQAAAAALASEGFDRGSVEAVASPGELLESRARLRLVEGDATAALEDFGRVADYARERADLGPGMTLWRSGSALAQLRLGNQAEARVLAGEELQRARHFGAARPLGAALVAAGLAAGAEGGLELLREAVGLLGESPFRLDFAAALVELGAAQRRLGQRAAAREPLREGLELARSCGAVPLAERAFEELRATGARPRKILRTGVEALTPSEERVAQLAASGKGNREIAQELFVSPRTVEFHLRQVFVKLEISSRRELPKALAA